MNEETILGRFLWTIICGALIGLAACSSEGAPDGRTTGTRTTQALKADADAEALEEAKFIIEHNATDQDTGFQAFIDGDPWNDLDISGPAGKLLKIEAEGELDDLGLTELFFETNEPENADVPIQELLEMMPEGSYRIEARSIEGTKLEATATLSHKIPAAPEITFPGEGAVVDPSELVISWQPVTRSLTGGTIDIAAYELIVEKDEDAHPTAFANVKLDVHVLPSVTSVTVPKEFLEPGTEYKFEVLAIEESGPQTITSSTFETE